MNEHGPDRRSIQLTRDSVDEVLELVPGTTRDAAGVRWRYVGAPFGTLYDTVIPWGHTFYRRPDFGWYARGEDYSLPGIKEILESGLKSYGVVMSGITYWKMEPQLDGSMLCTEVSPDEIP